MNYKERKSKEGTDEVDSPYTLIWNGKEWVCKPVNTGDADIDESEHKDSTPPIAQIITGTINLILPHLSTDESFSQSKYSMMKTVIGNTILLVCILLTLSISFFSENTLFDSSSNFFFSILFLYGVFSPVLILLKRCQSFSKFLVNIFALFLTLILISPIALYFSIQSNNMNSDSNSIDVYLYTMNQNENVTNVNVIAAKSLVKDVTKSPVHENYSHDEVLFSLEKLLT